MWLHQRLKIHFITEYSAVTVWGKILNRECFLEFSGLFCSLESCRQMDKGTISSTAVGQKVHLIARNVSPGIFTFYCCLSGTTENSRGKRSAGSRMPRSQCYLRYSFILCQFNKKHYHIKHYLDIRTFQTGLRISYRPTTLYGETRCLPTFVYVATF